MRTRMPPAILQPLQNKEHSERLQPRPLTQAETVPQLRELEREARVSEEAEERGQGKQELSGVHTCACTSATAHTWRSEDLFVWPVLSFLP